MEAVEEVTRKIQILFEMKYVFVNAILSNTFLHLILDGCSSNGRFYKGGETWALPNCKIGICAKSFQDGWQVSIEG